LFGVNILLECLQYREVVKAFLAIYTDGVAVGWIFVHVQIIPFFLAFL
jgi:hypothetical protein